MKRINTLLSAALLIGSTAFVFTSCEKNNTDLNPEKGKTITLVASTESAPDTKTCLGGENMTQVYWQKENDDKTIENDYIIIFGENGDKKTYKLESIDPENPTKATFIGDALSETPISAMFGWPGETESSIYIPPMYGYKPNNVSQPDMPMYAEISDINSPIEFKNLCGIVKLQLMKAEGVTEDVKVKTIEFTSEDDIAGVAIIAYNDGNPTLSSFTKLSGWPSDLPFSSKTITLQCIEDFDGDDNPIYVSLANYNAEGTGATVFYIVVPPTESNTFTIKVTTTDGKTMTKVAPADDANKIERNKITTMPALAFVADPVKYVDEWGIDRGEGITIDGVTWAPVNCGYLAASEDDATAGRPNTGKGYPYGKLYQWGRKDGQGYKEGSFEDASYPSGSNIANALTADGTSTAPDANTFYMGDSDASDSWLIKSETESAFDDTTDWIDLAGFGPKVGNPCPEGWRVPTYDELYALNTNYSEFISTGTTGPNDEEQGGFYLSGSTPYLEGGVSLFLPAAGSLSENDCKMTNRSIGGWYWSSSPSEYDNLSMCLIFFSWLSPEYCDEYRASGLSVRCVQE